MDGTRRLLAICLILFGVYLGLSTKAILILFTLGLFFLFIVIPTIFYCSGYVQRQMIFLTWVKWPKWVDFDLPEREGLNGTTNFYLESEPGVKIGVWHVLPSKMIEESQLKGKDWYRESLKSGDPIVIYMHGNTASRARDHRMSMYEVLRNLNFHVIAFDYRGYADSTQKTPTKMGVVTDGHAIYDYVKKNAPGVPVIVWGHSLGTGVSSQVVSELCLKGNPPNALILESPFNNIREEIKQHPMTYLWRKMPLFDWILANSLDRSDVDFTSDRVIGNISIPILILHAKDDPVVPFSLGEKLYKTALVTRDGKNSKPMFFIPFDASHGYAHVDLYLAPELPTIVSSFVQHSIKDDWTERNYEGHLLD